MNWFEKLCRNVGLMVHNVRRPDDAQRKVIKKQVHEEKQGELTLRRTTIEEIEIKRANGGRNTNEA